MITIYASINFPSKKQFKDAVREGREVTLFAPGLGCPNQNGKEFVSGPWYPLPHKWYAQVAVANGIVTKVK